MRIEEQNEIVHFCTHWHGQNSSMFRSVVQQIKLLQERRGEKVKETIQTDKRQSKNDLRTCVIGTAIPLDSSRIHNAKKSVQVSMKSYSQNIFVQITPETRKRNTGFHILREGYKWEKRDRHRHREGDRGGGGWGAGGGVISTPYFSLDDSTVRLAAMAENIPQTWPWPVRSWCSCHTYGLNCYSHDKAEVLTRHGVLINVTNVQLFNCKIRTLTALA